MIKKLSVAGAIIGALLVLLLICVALLADSLAGYDPLTTHYDERMSAPSRQHPYGTDLLGRDVQSRVIHGVRDDLIFAAGATLIALVAGGVLGIVAGLLKGGVIDKIIVFLGRFLASGPAILLAAVLAMSTFGPDGTATGRTVGVAIVLIPGFIRVIRGIIAGKVDEGANVGRRALMMAGAAASQVFISISVAILVYAGLSFLGIGAQPPASELGAAIASGRNNLHGAPYLMVYPALALITMTLSFNILGESLLGLVQPTERLATSHPGGAYETQSPNR